MNQIESKTEQLKVHWNKSTHKDLEKVFPIKSGNNIIYYIEPPNFDKFMSYYFDYICGKESTLERVLDEFVELRYSDPFFEVFFNKLTVRISDFLDEHEMPQTKELHIHTFSYLFEEFGVTFYGS